MIRERYEPLEVVGRGAQGEVVRALDHQHDRVVALKVRAVADDREALLSEARILLGVRPHPHLPLVREDFFEDERYYVAMDWIEGAPLAWGGSLDALLDALSDVAGALDHLHAHEPPIAHRDVKPANILVTSSGRAVLVDLGIALTGGAAGTRGYIAPEVAAGEHASAASDIFGLAATAYALLTGAPPRAGVAPVWGGLSDAEAERVERALTMGLAFDPARRPPTARALIEAMRAPVAPPTNLPPEPDEFIGRASEVAEVVNLVRAHRMVTLTGPGGIGKTRLAARAARATEFADGVWFVELAPVSDAGALVHAVAAAVGAREQPGSSERDSLVDHLRARAALLILDNCEQIVDACAHLAEDLVRACPHLQVLATSREALGVSAEVVWRVPPLPLADEAVALFIERARRQRADIEIDPGVVTQICARLDGLPLAIELAAARARTLPLAQIAARLDDRLSLLSGGRRTALPRQRTLRALIDWSYDLLEGDERAAFARCSVFAGGIAPDVAEAVVPMEMIERLADRSLLSLRGDRYVMLETIREYAAQKLQESDGEGQARAPHAAAFLALAQRAEPELTGPSQQRWLERLEVEADNMRAALSLFVRERDRRALQLTLALWRFFDVRGHLTEGRASVAAALAVVGDEATSDRASALRTEGVFAHQQGDHDTARARYGQSLALAREVGDERGVAACLHNLGTLDFQVGDNDAALARWDESLALRRALDDRRGIADSLTNLGMYASDHGDLARARELASECIDLFTDLGDEGGIADAASNLALIEEAVDDLAAARVRHDQSLKIRRALGDRWGIATSLANLGAIAVDLDERDRAAELLEEAERIQRDIGDREGIAFTLLARGRLAHADADARLAAVLFAESLRIRAAVGDEKGIAETLECEGALIAGTSEAATLLGAAQALRRRADLPRTPREQARFEQAIGVGVPLADVPLDEAIDLGLRLAQALALS